jgi:Resolvase, N terminal domain/Recombinase zinc beta ribbon domain
LFVRRGPVPPEAIAAVGRGEAAGIICEEQNRLSRENMRATAEVWEALEGAGARLVLTAEGIDTATGDHEFRFNINAAMAREQWKQYARRMAGMKQRKIEAGIWIGPVPLGFAKNPNKTLSVDPGTAGLVRGLFESRAAGASIPELARRLDGVGRRYSYQGVRTLLRNEVYMTGRPTYGDIVGPEIEGGRLVDVPLFQAVQARRDTRRGPRSADARWLLTGLAACANCGRNLHPMTDGDGYRRYRCANRHCPKRVSASALPLEPWVRDTAFMLLGSTLREAGSTPDTAPLEEALAVAERRLEQVMVDGVADDLGELWAPEVRRRREARDEAAAALGAAHAAGPMPERVRNLREEWDGMDPAERREALAVYYIRRVLVGGPRSTDWQVEFP